MLSLFTPEYRWLWTVALAVALFWPVRRLIWVLTVRRAIEKGGEETVDAAEQARLRRRAGMTAALLCFVFSYFYVKTWFH
tara:strand:- start:88 stop:327 length:240 start_codon:yes stop_codon:yes gene_type:complete